MTRHVLVLVACGAVVACSGSRSAAGTVAADAEPLALTVDAPRETLARGDSMRVRFELRNTGRDTLRLTFPSGCTLLPYVSGPDTLDIRYPAGGAWSCTMALSELTLVPGGVETREVLVATSGGESGDRAVLAPGNYLVFARLEHPERKLRSPMVPLTVR